jgi:hypothetical protein
VTGTIVALWALTTVASLASLWTGTALTLWTLLVVSWLLDEDTA